MSSAYKRDDASFRAHIAKLADSGLHLDCTKPRPQPAMPEHSRLSELICGLTAYAALALVIALLVRYMILPLWSAL